MLLTMNRLFYLLLFLGTAVSSLWAQCPTNQDKLIPERHRSQNNSFGTAVALHEDYLAVGDYLHDTLAYDGGAVFLYQRQEADWKLIATFLPSDSEAATRFGYSLTLTENHLFVGSQTKPHVYVFAKKNDWEGGTEDAIIPSPEESATFGKVIKALRNDEKLLITDPRTREGVAYIYTKPANGWTTASPSFIALEPPEDESATRSQFFGYTVDYANNKLAIGATDYKNGVGCVYLYQDQSNGEWNNFSPPARLLSSYPEGYSSEFGARIQIMHDNVLVQSRSGYPHAIFQFKPRPTWEDAQADTVYYLTDSLTREQTRFMVAHDSTLLAAGVSSDDKVNAYSFRLTSQNKLVQLPPQPLPDQLTYSNATHVSPQGTLAVGYFNNPTDRYQGRGIGIVPKKDHVWQFEQRQHAFYNYYTAAEDWFGSTMLRVEDYLLVGVPNDKRTSDAAGSVQLYQKNNGAWQKIHALTADSSQYFFGRALAFQNDTLFVATSRAITRYHRGASWQDWTPLPPLLLPDTLPFRRIGNRIRIEDSVLVATGQAQPSGQAMKSGLFIFKKEGNSWKYHQFLIVGNSYGIEGTLSLNKVAAMDFDIQNGIILTARHGVGLVIEQNTEGVWRVTASLNYDNKWGHNNQFGHSVLLRDQTAFVGVSRYSSQDYNHSGAVYVFKKAEHGWQNTAVDHIIQPSHPVAEEQFGSSLALQGDTLVIGAPGIDRALSLLNIPQRSGSVYIFRAPGRQWNRAVQLNRIQGDGKTSLDLYGSAVILNKDELLVGAPYDNPTSGVRGGAIYTGPVPPLPQLQVDTLVSTFCKSDPPVHLAARVSGGEWSGAGIVDAQAGTFDPAVAGTGQHQLHYQGPDCTYLAYRTVEVNSSFTLKLQHPSEQLLCQDETAVLSVNEMANVDYQWFYLAEGNEQSIAVGQATATLSVNRPGRYWATGSNGRCHQTSDTIIVRTTSPPVIITPPDSAFACPPFPVVSVENFQSGYQYFLYRADKQNDDILVGKIRVTPTELTQAGRYRVRTTFQQCEWWSKAFTIHDALNSLKLYPEETDLEVCTAQQWLEAPLRDGFSYTWYYQDQKTNAPIAIGHQSGLSAERTGYYYLTIQYGHCQWTSDAKYINFHEPITFEEAANVFTPNGDDINDTFGIPLLEATTYELSIYNRYGRLMYRTQNPQGEWDGHQAPAGVYFWVLYYNDSCDTTGKIKKGQISIIREEISP